jgi:hypothetical protein
MSVIAGLSRLRLVWLLGAGLLLLQGFSACQGADGPDRDDGGAGSKAALQPGEFDGARAYRDLERLSAIGPRASGTPGSKRARALLREALTELGADVGRQRLEIEVVESQGVRRHEITTLVGRLPGDSPDVFLLAAPYDSIVRGDVAGSSVDEGASGAALLLEIGRALAERPRPYTVWLAFIDGDGRGLRDIEDEASDTEPPNRFPGSYALARAWQQRGELERVRLAVFFTRVGQRDLTIARDLGSHRMYREVFFEAAQDLGSEAIFDQTGALETTPGGHRAFVASDLRQVVAIAGAPIPAGSDAAADSLAADTLERCSAESLAQVGEVTLEALDRIGSRLQAIDDFATAPHDSAPPEERAPPSSAAPPSQPGAP